MVEGMIRISNCGCYAEICGRHALWQQALGMDEIGGEDKVQNAHLFFRRRKSLKHLNPCSSVRGLE